MTEQETKQAMDRLPKELHLLLAWLVSGQHYSGSKLNGTA